jgi:tartrate-resistant acid phosphatase type 5
VAFPPISENVRIAVIGDFGLMNPREADVAALVKGWTPDAIFTVGDNNYPFGSAETIDLNIGQYYSGFIAPYQGAFGPGAAENRFFPALGNHDWLTESAQPYLDYFTLPGNERYYDMRLGPTHWFVLDSQPDEPDGITVDSVQATWLREALAASDAPWKLVILHHPPYSSGVHEPLTELRWPFAEWGATAVLSGHDHIYERILRDGIVYFVNGSGGTVLYDIGNPVEGSQVRYNEDFGALQVDAMPTQITFQFVTRTGVVVDTYTVTR